VKWPPKPHNNGKVIMEFYTNKRDKDEKQWVHSNSIVQQKDMLILQIRTNTDRLVKTTKKIKVPNGIYCYTSVNTQLRKSTDIIVWIHLVV
jgi:hypothetical protein